MKITRIVKEALTQILFIFSCASILKNQDFPSVRDTATESSIWLVNFGLMGPVKRHINSH